ncbi:MAG: acetoin utilization protein AcuC [Candidatus Thorarchaeota archaeon]
MDAETVLFSPDMMLALDGLDDIRRMRGTENPYWNRARFEIVWGLAVETGLTESEHLMLVPMREATREELLIYHDPSYVETVELFSNMGSAYAVRFGLDSEECPIFPNVDTYARYPVGATVDATMGVAEGKFKNAVSFFGGFHHATESKAAGFCYYNDCVVALKRYRKEYPGKRVLYLDTDAHHGDGTQRAFYSDPNVLTISMHELSIGFFPGSGRVEEIGTGPGKGYSINIPLPPLTDDYEFWRAFEEVVVPIWRVYAPDLVFWEIGADCHMYDPLADLMLTNDTYARMSETVRRLVSKMNSGLVVVGGGGYNPAIAARIWTMILSDLIGVRLPTELPPRWVERCNDSKVIVYAEGWTDRPYRVSCDNEPSIRRAVSETIDKIKETVFPLHGL